MSGWNNWKQCEKDREEERERLREQERERERKAEEERRALEEAAKEMLKIFEEIEKNRQNNV